MRSTLRSLIDLLDLWEWLFLVLAGLAGGMILLYATAVYGAGVSSDSMFYISSADNFVRGKGFFDFKGDALIDFPPLYPLVLGVLSWASGFTPFVLGRYLNALVMSLLIVSSGLLFVRCFPERKVWFYLGTLATLLFLPLYTLAANIATDLIYILLTIWFCLAAQWFLRTRSYWAMAVMTTLAAACAFLRWVGLALVAAEFILILIAYRKQIIRAILFGILFCGLASLPVVLWVGLRNQAVYGTLGRIQVETQKVNILENLRISISRIIAWTAPNPAVYCLPLFLVLVVVVLLVNRKKDWVRWLQKLTSQPILPILILSGVYFFSTLVAGYTADRSLPYDNRYQAPLYFCLLVILFVSMDELVLAHLQRRALQAVLIVFTLGFGLWSLYQASLVSNFIQVSRRQGVAEYNEYNNKQFVRSGVVVYLLKNPPPADIPLYSNEPEAVYFFLRRLVEMSPVDQSHYNADPNALASLYPHWPAEKEAYLIWFKPNIKRQYYSPDEIEQLSTMDRLYKRWDGEVYLVRPKD